MSLHSNMVFGNGNDIKLAITFKNNYIKSETYKELLSLTTFSNLHQSTFSNLLVKELIEFGIFPPSLGVYICFLRNTKFELKFSIH